MREIVVKKVDLIEVLKKNRAEHRDAFLEAQKGYREMVIKILDEELALARAEKPVNIARITMVRPPSDHTGDYDRVIGMLGMDTSPEVVLSEHDYQMYVQDEWGWTVNFANEVTAYGVTSPKLSKYTNQ